MPAPDDNPRADSLRFGRFELRPREQRLLADGQPLPLGGRAFDLLLVLVRQAGALVTRNELIEQVWPGRVVEENNLSVQINALRKALGPEAVVTVPGRGYRFTLRAQANAVAAPDTNDLQRSAAAAIAPTRLPIEQPLLIGRSDDLAALATLIDQHRLVTIVGAGGMGKTRLAQALLQLRAAAAPQGVCWVELAGVSAAEALPGAVAVALGLQPEAGPALASLAQAVAGLQMLVALDNAEHLVDAVAALAQALLDAAPGLRLVVTSQVPLRLATERVWRLGPLAVPQDTLLLHEAQAFAAVALFAERAHAADSRFRLTDATVPAVIALCRKLDGVALAIELAAARAPALGVERLAASMSERLRLLTVSRDRRAPPRQQTLRAALAWSHGLLGEPEQRLFRRLAVFPGGATLERIQAVAADRSGEGDLDEWALVDALDQLVQRSLVELVLQDEGEVPPRYRLLESPRALALEHLTASGEEALMRTRHAHALRAAWDDAETALNEGRIGVLAWRGQAEPELDAAREALAWARARGDEALARARASGDEALAGARASGDEALARASASGDDALALALASALVPRLPPALRDERQQRARDMEGLIQRVPDRAAQQRAWLAIAFAGRHRRAAGEALALARQMHHDAGAAASEPDRLRLFVALCESARAEVLDGSIALAEAQLDEARSLEDPRWPPVRLRIGVRAQAVLATWRNDLPAALALYRRLQVLNRAAGDPALQGQLSIADLELSSGDARAALATLQSLLPQLLRHRDELRLALARVVMADAHLALDEIRAAREALRLAWPGMLRIGREADALEVVALAAALDGRAEDAARCLGAADARRAGLTEVPAPHEGRTRARALATIAGPLGPQRMADGIAAGAALSKAELQDLVEQVCGAR